MRRNHNPESDRLPGSARAWSAARNVNAHGALPHSDARTFHTATTTATQSPFTEKIKEAQKVRIVLDYLFYNCDVCLKPCLHRSYFSRSNKVPIGINRFRLFKQTDNFTCFDNVYNPDCFMLLR